MRTMTMRSRRGIRILCAVLLAAGFGCLNRLNLTSDSIGDLGQGEGVAFGEIAIEAPDDLDADLGPPEAWMAASTGARVQLVSADDRAREYRFIVPPHGRFRWALPAGAYRLTGWIGLLRDEVYEIVEAHLTVSAEFRVSEAAATYAGTLRVDGRAAASVLDAGSPALDGFRAEFPSFKGRFETSLFTAVEVRPPMRIVRRAPPGGGDTCSLLPRDRSGPVRSSRTGRT